MLTLMLLLRLLMGAAKYFICSQEQFLVPLVHSGLTAPCVLALPSVLVPAPQSLFSPLLRVLSASACKDHHLTPLLSPHDRHYTECRAEQALGTAARGLYGRKRSTTNESQ